MDKKQKYVLSSFQLLEHTYIVEAYNMEEAMEIAMEMDKPTHTEMIEEGFYDAETVTLN